MSRTQQLEHKGKTIFYMDFSNAAHAAEIRDIMTESVQYIRTQPPCSVLTISNVTGMRFSNEIKELFNEFLKDNKPYIKASAVIGLNGLQLIFNGLLKITGRHINVFNSTEEAKEWLVNSD